MTSTALDIINAFFEPYRLGRYNKGQVLLLAGEPTEYIYYLLDGRVKVYTISYRGDEVILHIHTPPDFFPIPQAFTQATSSYIYEADSEIVIQKAPIQAIRKLLSSRLAVTLYLLKQSYKYIDYSLERQALLMAGSAKQKLMFELTSQCRRFNTEAIEDYRMLDIHETELAARTGLSRETVNREIQKLKKENLIRLIHRRIFIPHIGRLEHKLAHSI